MTWRLASRLSVITLAILVVLIVSVFTARRDGSQASNNVNASTTTQSSELPGTDLGGTPAPGFELKDQNGQAVSLAQFKGKPVIVTFLYTHCPDVCPLTAEQLHQTMQQLGGDAHNVGVVAISSDPKRDDQAAAQNFTKVHQMEDYWHFLIGSHEQLSPVWSSYRVYAQPRDAANGKGTVDHSSAIFVLDKQGRERSFINGNSSFKPEQLAKGLRFLIKE